MKIPTCGTRVHTHKYYIDAQGLDQCIGITNKYIHMYRYLLLKEGGAGKVNESFMKYICTYIPKSLHPFSLSPLLSYLKV